MALDSFARKRAEHPNETQRPPPEKFKGTMRFFNL
jgi:hypothetical protein